MTFVLAGIRNPIKNGSPLLFPKWARGTKVTPEFIFILGPKGLMLGGGLHMLERDELERVHKYIQRNSAEFTILVKDKKFIKMFGELKGEKNKVLPAEFKKDVENQPYLANKAFYFIAEYRDPKVILRPDLIDFMISHYKVGKDLSNYFKKALN